MSIDPATRTDRRPGDCLLDRLPARTGGVLCWRHHDVIARMLDPDNHGDAQADIPASIPVMWRMLDLTPGRGVGAERRPPGFRSTPPLSLHLAVMRDDRSRVDPQVWFDPHPSGMGDDETRWHVEEDDPPKAIGKAIESLVDSLVEDLALEGPHLPDNRFLTDLTVAGMCTWLHGRVHDITARDDADYVYDTLLELSDQLRPAVGDRHLGPTGRCIEMIRDPYTRTYRDCGCPLYMPPPTPDPAGETSAEARHRAATEPIVTCRRCRRDYTWLELIRLRLAQPA